MSEDSTSAGLNRFFAFASGAGTATWGISEMVQQQVLPAVYGDAEIGIILTGGILFLFGGASILGGFGWLGTTKNVVCGAGDDN